jgi:hypothetical protein
MNKVLLTQCLSLAALFSGMAFAQSTGAIHGSAQDSSGATIPEVQVTAIQQGTNLTRQTTTNSAGEYLIPELPVGTYEVRFAKTGFASFLQRNVLLQVSTNVEVNGMLQVAGATTEVTVNAEATLVQTTNTAVIQVVDQKRVEDLPLNGRNVLQLVTINAGVADRGATGSTIQTNTLSKGRYQVPASVNGSRGNATNYTLDGADNNDSYTNIAAPFPNPDAVQEFSIQTNAFDAQYGRGVGGIVNMVTRSGTNSFHGTVFEYLRNNVLNAGNFFSGRDALKRNQFGFSIGGPVLLPKLYNGRNRTFVFGSYQGTRDSVATPGFSVVAPSAAMKQGDLSAFLKSDGTGRIKDPLGGYFPNNQIPVSRFDPVATNLLKYFPVSNDPNYVARFGTPANRTNEDQYVLRGDQIITPKQQLTLRYFLLRYDNPWSYIPDNILYVVNGQFGNAHNAALVHTYTITPRLLNQFVVGFNRQTPQSSTPAGLNVNFQSAGSRINLAPSPTMDLAVTGWTGATLGLGYVSAGTSYSIGDNVSFITGRHSLRFGFSVNRSRMDKNSNFTSGGNATFSGLLSSDPGKSNAGNSFAEFLLGEVDAFLQQSMWSERIQLQTPALYIQDDIRLTRRLTANLGLRWDPRFDIRENEFDKKMTFLPNSPAFQSTRFPNAPHGLAFLGDPGFEDQITKNKLKNFAPRVGLAFQLTPRTVLRGAYGIFYDQQMLINNNRSAQGAPFIQQVLLNSVSLSNPYGSGTPINPSPIYPGRDFIFSPGQTWSLPSVDMPTGYMQQWNVIAERQFRGDMLLRVGYIGSKGTHLLSNAEVNPAIYGPGATAGNRDARRPFQPIGSLTLTSGGGWSSYNSLQVTAQKRYSHGISILVNYTWSKAIDNSSFCQGDGPCMGPDYSNWNANRGLSDFDTPHRLVASGILEHPTLAKWNPVARNILGGWQSNFILVAQSGIPFTVVSGVNNSLTGVGNDFADLTGVDWRRDHSSKSDMLANYFNTAAFKVNAVGTIGTGRRNQLRGPNNWTLNYSLFKTFRITEQFKLDFRGEFFNILNHANFGQPNANVSSAAFGRITTADSPRIIQFGLKLSF